MKNKNFKNISTTIAIALIFLMVSSVYATLPIKAQIVPGQGGTHLLHLTIHNGVQQSQLE